MEIKKGKKVIGYIRVSTKGQAEEGLSLDAQTAKIHQYCELYNHEVIEIFCDPGVSAKNMNRPSLKKALEKVGEDEILMFHNLSRLTRRSRDLYNIVHEMETKGAHLVSINEQIDTTTAAGRMFFGLMAVLNQFESEQVSERTKAIIEHKRKKGEIVGTARFGYKIGDDKKSLVEIEDEQKIIRLMASLKAQSYTYQEIADQLNNDGILTRRGSQWKFQYVYKILKAG